MGKRMRERNICEDDGGRREEGEGELGGWGGCYYCYIHHLQLINRCWAFQPSSRPTFDQIRRIVDRINPNRESPVDMMMIMVSGKVKVHGCYPLCVLVILISHAHD